VQTAFRLRFPIIRSRDFIMHFGETLKQSIYEPWRSSYIDYAVLKSLLREHDTKGKAKEEWTEEDEGRFVEELVNVQLEKVNAFQVDTYRSLRERTSECEEILSGIKSTHESEGDDKESTEQDTARKKAKSEEVLEELDKITMEVNELEKYSRLNFTGFLKAAKKHDRQRGSKYRVRPLLQVRLASLPFNAEDYSPLLYR
jgi:SPX domain protein involved in polyphosphate accumulation